MSRAVGLEQPIPEPKLRALREKLEADGEVRFKNGSVVTREETSIIVDGLTGEGKTLVHYTVTRPAGGIAQYGEDSLYLAYAMALRGPQPKKPGWMQAQDEQKALTMFGDEAPW